MEKVGVSNLTSYSPDGVKSWRVTNEEELIYEPVGAFWKINDQSTVPGASHECDRGMIFVLCECAQVTDFFKTRKTIKCPPEQHTKSH